MFKCSFTIVSNASTINMHFQQTEALVGAKYCETLCYINVKIVQH